MELDRQAMVRTVEDRLRVTDDPRRRQHLEVLLAHMHGEIGADVDALVATVSHKVAYHSWGSPNLSPVGRDEVRAFYEQMADEGRLYFQYDIEHLVVDDDVIVTEGVMKSLTPTRSLTALGIADDGGVHLMVLRMTIFWPFAADGLLLGEDSYSSFVSLEPVSADDLPLDHPSRVSA